MDKNTNQHSFLREFSTPDEEMQELTLDEFFEEWNNLCISVTGQTITKDEQDNKE